MDSNWLTPRDIAKDQKVSVKVVTAWIRNGEFPGAMEATVRRNARNQRFRVPRKDYEAFCESRRILPSPKPKGRKQRPEVDLLPNASDTDALGYIGSSKN